MPVFRDVQTSRNDGWVAQLVEQRIENPRVDGSIPPPATKLPNHTKSYTVTSPMFKIIWAFLLSQFASCNFLTYPNK
jgi:hypothetical protein